MRGQQGRLLAMTHAAVSLSGHCWASKIGCWLQPKSLSTCNGHEVGVARPPDWLSATSSLQGAGGRGQGDSGYLYANQSCCWPQVKPRACWDLMAEQQRCRNEIDVGAALLTLPLLWYGMLRPTCTVTDKHSCSWAA